MFIHPLPTHLAKRAVSSEEKWTPHLIYKNSSEIDFDVQSLKRGIIFFCKETAYVIEEQLGH